MKIAEFLSPQAVIPALSARTKPELLRELATALVKLHPSVKVDRMVEVLMEREKLGSTGIGEGVAIPHGKLQGLPRLLAVFGVAKGGVDFEAIDGKPTELFFALVAPENSAGVHLKALARISRLFKSQKFRDAILAAEGQQAIYQLIIQEDGRV
jgi:PTS system nitrogen regulatory IIA component